LSLDDLVAQVERHGACPELPDDRHPLSATHQMEGNGACPIFWSRGARRRSPRPTPCRPSLTAGSRTPASHIGTPDPVAGHAPDPNVVPDRLPCNLATIERRSTPWQGSTLPRALPQKPRPPSFLRLPPAPRFHRAMTSGAIRIGRIRGIDIRVHFTFLLVLPFLAFSFARAFLAAALAAGIPPQLLRGSPWLWGMALAVALFGSVLLHELAHSLYGVRKGGEIRGITLLMIGGVSEVTEMPPRPRDEAIMALLGRPRASASPAPAIWCSWRSRPALSPCGSESFISAASISFSVSST
jgi:hypothetical protein